MGYDVSLFFIHSHYILLSAQSAYGYAVIINKYEAI